MRVINRKEHESLSQNLQWFLCIQLPQRVTRTWKITWDTLGMGSRDSIWLYPHSLAKTHLQGPIKLSDKCPNYQSVPPLHPTPRPHTALSKTNRNNITYQWFSKCDPWISSKRITRELTPMPHAGITKSESPGIRLSNLGFNKFFMWFGSTPMLKITGVEPNEEE